MNASAKSLMFAAMKKFPVLSSSCTASASRLQPAVTTSRYAASVPTSVLSRSVVTTTRPVMGLEEFRDTVSEENRAKDSVGRSWTVKELRRKSFDDLHKLWLVLYKERNMLMTEGNHFKRRGVPMPQADRRHKVKKSMGAIKAVLGERKLDKIAQHALKMAQMRDYEDEDQEENTEAAK